MKKKNLLSFYSLGNNFTFKALKLTDFYFFIYTNCCIKNNIKGDVLNENIF